VVAAATLPPGSFSIAGSVPMYVAMDGIAGVQARIAEIQSRFGAPAVSTNPSSSATGSSDFSSLLDQLQSTSSTGSTGSTEPAGTATTTREQWAHDFLTRLGMPVTAENVKAMVAWQRAEGTRAQNNPLATTQSMPGATRFNSVGVKNFVTYDDGITANIKAITNGRYPNILAALQAGNSAEAVGQAIAASPWGTGQGVLRVLHSS
jgi:hypothetical protein